MGIRRHGTREGLDSDLITAFSAESRGTVLCNRK